MSAFSPLHQLLHVSGSVESPHIRRLLRVRTLLRVWSLGSPSSSASGTSSSLISSLLQFVDNLVEFIV